MKKTLMWSMLLSGLLPLLAVVTITEYQASSLFEAEAKKRLQGVLQGRKSHLEDYLNSLLVMSESVAENDLTAKALQTFARQIEKIPANNKKKTPELTEAVLRERMVAYYNSHIGAEFSARAGVDLPVGVEQLLPPTESGLFLQWSFLAENENPVGEKHRLAISPVKSSYNQVHKKSIHFFTTCNVSMV